MKCDTDWCDEEAVVAYRAEYYDYPIFRCERCYNDFVSRRQQWKSGTEEFEKMVAEDLLNRFRGIYE